MKAIPISIGNIFVRKYKISRYKSSSVRRRIFVARATRVGGGGRWKEKDEKEKERGGKGGWGQIGSME